MYHCDYDELAGEFQLLVTAYHPSANEALKGCKPSLLYVRLVQPNGKTSDDVTDYLDEATRARVMAEALGELKPGTTGLFLTETEAMRVKVHVSIHRDGTAEPIDDYWVALPAREGDSEFDASGFIADKVMDSYIERAWEEARDACED